MARIVGVDIPNEKRVVISLTYIYGIGLTTSQKILKACNISEDIRVKDLTDDQLNAIRNEVSKLKEPILKASLTFTQHLTIQLLQLLMNKVMLSHGHQLVH